jgi:hypothetical protein
LDYYPVTEIRPEVSAMKRVHVLVLSLLLVLYVSVGAGQTPGTGANRLTTEVFEGLALRSIGPTLTTGRIADVDVDPKNPNIWYVASAAGGLWKTENRGLTFEPIFDRGGSFNLC